MEFDYEMITQRLYAIFTVIVSGVIIALLSGIPYCLVTQQWQRPVNISLRNPYDQGFLETIFIALLYTSIFVGCTLLLYYGNRSNTLGWLGMDLMIFGVIILMLVAKWKMG